jgi:hypothetical protein
MTRKERMRIAKHVERFARVASGEKAFKRVQATDESVKELDKPVTFDKPKPMVTLTKGELGKKVQVSRAQARLMVKTGWKVVKEDIAYKDGTIAMYKGGWIAKRNGKRLGTTMPTDQHAKDLLDATRKSLAQKTMAALKSKARGVMRGLGVRIPKKPRRAWDAAILPEEKTENSK